MIDFPAAHTAIRISSRTTAMLMGGSSCRSRDWPEHQSVRSQSLYRPQTHLSRNFTDDILRLLRGEHHASILGRC